LRFTVRRPPNGEVSPCGHRPSGGDVACGVDVGVAPSGIAGFAVEDRLALAVLGSDVPARGASLRRVRGRSLFDPTVSLVLQTRGEKTPTASADSAVQPALLSNAHAGLLNSSPCTAGHRAHVKGFDSDCVEAPRDVSGDFFDPVLAPVGLTRSQLRDLPKPFMHTGFTPRRAAVSTGKEVLHGLCVIPQRLLLHRLTPGTKPGVLGARLRQLRRLLDIVGSPAPRLPVLLLLYRQIPHIPRITAMRHQCLLLLRGGQQPEPGHTRTVKADTDIPDEAGQPHSGDWCPPRTEIKISSRKRFDDS
jgi:hypothetical protein